MSYFANTFSTNYNLAVNDGDSNHFAFPDVVIKAYEKTLSLHPQLN